MSHIQTLGCDQTAVADLQLTCSIPAASGPTCHQVTVTDCRTADAVCVADSNVLVYVHMALAFTAATGPQVCACKHVAMVMS